MNNLQECPVCRSSDLTPAAQYCFRKPDTRAIYPRTQDLTYTCERLFLLFDMVDGPQQTCYDFSVSLCSQCGFLFLNPRFTHDELRKKYQMVETLESELKRKQASPELRQDVRARRVFRFIQRFGSRGNSPRCVMDFGGAQGFNLADFLTHGDDCFVVDYVKTDLIPGVQWGGRTLDEFGRSKRGDIVLMSHILEHVPDPVDSLREMGAFLSDSGVIYIEVPLGAWREYSCLAEPVTHINFFSEQSLYQCIERAGLVPLHVSSGFLWVKHNRMWCIRAIAARSGRPMPRYRTTRSQMNGARYYWRYFKDNPAYFIRFVKNQYWRIKKQIKAKLKRIPK